MSNSLFRFAGIKRCIFSVFLLGFRTFYPLHVLQPHKIIPGTFLILFDRGQACLPEGKSNPKYPTGKVSSQMSKVDQWVGSSPKVNGWTETLKPSTKKIYEDYN